MLDYLCHERRTWVQAALDLRTTAIMTLLAAKIAPGLRMIAATTAIIAPSTRYDPCWSRDHSAFHPL